MADALSAVGECRRSRPLDGCSLLKACATFPFRPRLNLSAQFSSVEHCVANRSSKWLSKRQGEHQLETTGARAGVNGESRSADLQVLRVLVVAVILNLACVQQRLHQPHNGFQALLMLCLLLFQISGRSRS